MKHSGQLVLIFILAALTAYATAQFSRPAAPKKAETLYERVLRTGTIRCGYAIYSPMILKDPNTGEMTGIARDIIETAATRLDLKVEWTEEVGWGQFIEALNADRFDVFCAVPWANAVRGKNVDFSVPLFYSGMSVYVRPDDHRFDNDLSAVNSPEVRIATMDGEMTSFIAEQDFPKAATVSIPQLADFAQIPMNVATGKADVAFIEDHVASEFLEKKPGALRNVTPGKPLRIFANILPFKKGEIAFENTLNIILQEMHNDGTMERILKRHEKYPGNYYRVALPYQPK